MRLTCDVDMCNRLLPSFNMRQKGKSAKSQLSIGRKPGSKQGSIYLLICTKQDRSGHQFMLEKNVQQCFTKFVSEGKATLRLIEPPYDLCLSKADPVQLKGLLSVVKMAVQGKNVDQITLSSLAPATAKQVDKLKTKLTILNRRDYPITKSFPSSLEQLAVHNCSLKKIDSRMLMLRRLTVLDLSNNAIKDLCDGWNNCENLRVLKLQNNQIESIPQGMCTGTLSKTLHTLDLSDNKINILRPYLCNLNQLKDLKLDQNQLRCLPMQFGTLHQLRQFSITNNKLQTLPASFCQLHLENLDLFGNEFLTVGPNSVINRLEFPTLLEWAARAIVKQRVVYTEEDVGHLIPYLASVKYCMCGSPCFRNHVHYLTDIDLLRVSASVTAIDTVGRMRAPCEAFLCSHVCLAKYQKNPNATIWR